MWQRGQASEGIGRATTTSWDTDVSYAYTAQLYCTQGVKWTCLQFPGSCQRLRSVRLDTADEGEDVVIVEGDATLVPAGTVDSTLPAYVEKYARLMARIGTSPESMAARYRQAIQITPARFLPG